LPPLELQVGDSARPGGDPGAEGLRQETNERRGLTQQLPRDVRREVDVAERDDRRSELGPLERRDQPVQVRVVQALEEASQVQRAMELLPELGVPPSFVFCEGDGAYVPSLE